MVELKHGIWKKEPQSCNIMEHTFLHETEYICIFQIAQTVAIKIFIWFFSSKGWFIFCSVLISQRFCLSQLTKNSGRDMDFRVRQTCLASKEKCACEHSCLNKEQSLLWEASQLNCLLFCFFLFKNFFVILISPIQFFFSAIQHGDLVTHTCIHSIFSHFGISRAQKKDHWMNQEVGNLIFSFESTFFFFAVLISLSTVPLLFN